MTFAQSRLRLLRNKIHLDGELLLLVLFQRPNVVTQAPSRDDEFSPFAHRLILQFAQANVYPPDNYADYSFPKWDGAGVGVRLGANFLD